ncbi:hypothetical protein D5S17_18590 [Pseudonocardiaceae bacterium YIM PH 21723]|nr:hypothetical protein D5S17_18590 [Pseudonocardiaceae bacterium YIM PH 21723]
MVAASPFSHGWRAMSRIVPNAEGPYRRLSHTTGEPHQVRTDLTEATPGESRSLLRFVHITDFQLADPASPGRLDFLQRFAGEPEWADMLPAYRPQEPVSLHAFEAMVRTIRELGGLDFVITTGDNTDSAALNELDAYMSIMDGGGTVDPTFGVSDLQAIPAHIESGDYWNPELSSRDVYKRHLEFPDYPGLLAAAGKSFDTVGFGAPWLACFGNHDCLAQGRAPETSKFHDLITGGHRPTAAPDAPPAGDKMEHYLADPTFLSGGAGVQIEPRADRRMVSRAEYIRAHLDSATGPAGHGFTEQNIADGTAYYSHDLPGVRVIVLDSTNPAGGVRGSIDARQFAWLEGELTEAQAAGRIIVLASHHGLSMMDNVLGDERRYLAADIEGLLHRFPNVALWLIGHIHRNQATPRPGANGGFWEVCTSAMAEWPTQTRLIELSEAGGVVTIRCTMIDHQAPVQPGAELNLWDLASIHREVSANEPTRVGGPESAGTPLDRNVDLLVRIVDRA